MKRFNGLITAIVGIAFSVSAGAAELQWGFDFTSGSVADQNGGVILNDGTNGAILDGGVYNDIPTYSSDVPTAGDLQNATGVGSIDTTIASGGTIRTTGGGIGDLNPDTNTFATVGDAIAAAGGITIECWTRQLVANEASGDQFVLDLGGYFVVVSSGPAAQGGWKLLANSSNNPTPVFSLSEAAKVAAGWIHVAGVFSMPSNSKTGPDNISSLYINGSLVDQKTDLAYYPSLGDGVRPINVGSDRNGNKRFEGLVFEPRVTIGALTPADFTFVLRDDDLDGLPDLWEENFFGDITVEDGSGDPDFDDVNNLEEYFRGMLPVNPDSDSDGLTDLVETGTGNFIDAGNTGTGPTDSDTDNDGVIDGAEVLIYGSDPFQEDADFDGSPDIVEITVGTDPDDLFDDPIDYFNLLMGNMAVGDDWTTGLFFNFGSADADDAWVIGGSGTGFGQLIRSPEGVGTTYPGSSQLILSGAGSVVRLKQDDGETVTINDLRLRGGTLDNGNAGMTQILAGTITVESSGVSNQATTVTTDTTTNATFRADIDSVINLFEGSRNLNVDATLQGDSGLILRQSNSSATPGTLNIRSMDNPYTGAWTIREGALLKGGGLNSLGSGNIRIEDAGLDSDYTLALLDSTLTLANPAGVLVVDKDHYVGAMTIGTNAVVAGTYTAAQLAALADPAYSNAFVDGGGSVTVTGIGVGDADGNGIPDAWEVAEFGSNGQDPNSDTHDSDGLTIGQEFAAGTDPQVADSDGDTLNDGPELFTHGTDPTKDDTDGDTLKDGEELAGVGARPATDPTDADTDGDGLDDFVESNTGTFAGPTDTGTDPTNTDSDGDAFTDGVEVSEGTDPTDINDKPAILFRNDFDTPVIGTWTEAGTGSFIVGTGAATGGGNLPRNHDLNDGNWLRVAGGGGTATVLGTGELAAPGALDGTTEVSFDHHAFTSGTAGRLYALQGFDGSNQLFDVAFDMQNQIYINGVLQVEPNDAFEGLQWTKVTVILSPSTFDVVVQQYAPPGPGASGAIVVVTDAPSMPTGKSDLYSGIAYLNSGAQLTSVVIDGNSNQVGSEPLEFVDNIVARSIVVDDIDMDGLPDPWEIDNFGSITNWTGLDDPDLDLLDNAGEFNRGTDPNIQDTDDDGLNDNVETGTGSYVNGENTGTNPLVADTDGDGLEDGVENDSGIYVDADDTGTNPHDADTDGDTFGDGTEVEAGSDPHLSSSIPEWCSGAFIVRYDAIGDVPSVENAVEGWVEVDNAAAGVGILWTNGSLLIDTYDTSTNAATSGGAWIENPSGGDWGAAAASGNPSYTVEARLRVLADAGAFGINIWAGHSGDPGIALANITTNAVYWGNTRDVYLTDTDGVDNATDFHTYRLLYNADTSSYSMYRDGILLADGLGAAIANSQTRVILGDIGSAGSVTAEVDYFRWDMGIPWTPSVATADCDGDGLLNNEEDVNGNGVVDPGETDEGLADTDGDGSSDSDELWVTGTDPTDGDSVFELVDADIAPTGQLTWSSVPGKTYRVQFTSTMEPPAWVDLADIPADATGNTTSVTDPTPTGAEGHYRVLVLTNP